MAAKKDTKKLIKDLADIIRNTDLTEIELEEDGVRIRVAIGGQAFPSIHVPPAQQTPPTIDMQVSTAAVDNKTNQNAVKSPMVGTVYLSSDPDSPPFIKEGDTVKSGQTLFIVEAMKVMNPINSPKAGTIVNILVSDNEPVEFEQPLVIIE